jgi:membrane protease YdiL (CAAX protease family)
LDKEKRNTVGKRNLTSRWSTTIGLFVILGSEFILRDALISRNSRELHIGIVIIVEWIFASLLMFFWVPKVEHRKLSSIGFKGFRWKYVLISCIAYVIYFVISLGAELGLQSAGLQGLRGLTPLLKGYNFLILLGLFLTGTFVEEIIYRGYIIERVTELAGHRWVAGIVSWLTFTLVHLRFFGVGATIEVAIIAAILVTLYIKTKCIWPSIIMHGINDIFGFLIGPLFM